MSASKKPKKNKSVAPHGKTFRPNSVEHQQMEVVERSYRELHCGPIPDPRTLASYNQIDGTFAERIVCMAESEQSHRHAQEDRIVKTETSCRKAGMACGLLIGLATIGGGTACVLLGHEVSGVIFGISGLTGLVSVFVIGDRRKDDDSPKIGQNGEPVDQALAE